MPLKVEELDVETLVEEEACRPDVAVKGAVETCRGFGPGRLAAPGQPFLEETGLPVSSRYLSVDFACLR